jgi:hypothetical protein
MPVDQYPRITPQAIHRVIPQNLPQDYTPPCGYPYPQLTYPLSPYAGLEEK